MDTSDEATLEMRAMAHLLLRSRDASAAGFGMTDYAAAMRELDATRFRRIAEVADPEAPLWPPAPRLHIPGAQG